MKILRLLVVVVVALMVPVQGMAAATAGLCTALGHLGAGASMANDSGLDHDHELNHHHDDSTASHHHHDRDSGAQNKDDAHCPPCVSCCAAAAISSFTQVFTPEAGAARAMAAIPLSFSGIPPQTLDRPPLAG
jgi:hypothetical protein